MKSRQVVVCSLRVKFMPTLDVSKVLLSYQNAAFELRLFTPGPSIAGELSLKTGAELAARLRKTLPQPDLISDNDNVFSRTRNDIERVLACEQQVFAGALSFSFSDDIFDFSKTIDTDQSGIVIARQLILEHFAFPFVETLGESEELELL
jgi:hypothetical protein